jgi:hypothetical protein
LLRLLISLDKLQNVLYAAHNFSNMPPASSFDRIINKFSAFFSSAALVKLRLPVITTSLPKEYYRMYDLDKKKYPLVCKEYSAQRRKLAIDKGLGAGLRRKKASA